MPKNIHPNANIASNMLRLYALLTIVNYFLFSKRNSLTQAEAIFIAILLLLGIAYLIRKGYNWIRWIMLVLVVIGLALDVFILPQVFKLGLVNGMITITLDLIQIAATVLIFIPYRIPVNTLPNYPETDELESTQV